MFNEKDIKERYQEVSKTYDEASKKDEYKAPSIIQEWIDNPNKKRILDLGCGTGLSSKKLIEKGACVTGIDLSEEMLKIAQKYGFEKLICQNLEEPLNVKEDYYDIALMVGLWNSSMIPKKYLLKSIKNSLKGGLLYFTIPVTGVELDYNTYTLEEIEKILKKTGFEIIEKKKFIAYKHKMGKEKKNVYYTVYKIKKSSKIRYPNHGKP